MLYSIAAVLVIILDQAVKYWVSNTLFGTDIVKFIPGVISLVNIHNDGAAFSFLSGSGARIPFIVITGVFTVAVIIALATNFISGRVARWSIVLVTAGGLANCIDRIIYGYVLDMFKVELFDFAIFNVADIFITVFAIVFAIAMIFERQEDDEEDEYYDEEEDEKPKREKKERKGLMSRLKKDGDLDEDEPVREPRGAGRKKGKKSQYEEEYEQYKAERATRKPVDNHAAVRSQTAPVSSGADPFAEWEKANARLDSQRGSSAAARAMGAVPPAGQQQPVRQRPTAPSVDPRAAAQPQPGYPRPPQPRPVQPQLDFTMPAAQPQQPTQQRPAAQSNYQRPVQPPQQPAVPRPAQQPTAQPPKAAPKAAPKGDDFSLDDILNEFK